MHRPTRIAVVALAALVPALAAGQAIYKSIDAEGNVIYSDKPPDSPGQSVETITPAPPPDPAAVREAEERARQVQQSNEQQERERQTREAQKATPDGASPRTTTIVPVPVDGYYDDVPAGPWRQRRGNLGSGDRPHAAPRSPRR